MSKKRQIATTAIFAVCVVAVALTIFASYPQGKTSGEVRSTGKPHGDFVIRPVGCFTGGHWGFTGVFVVTKTLTSGSRRGFKGGLKIRKNDNGAWEPVVENPTLCEVFTCHQFVVDKKYCEVFEVDVQGMNMWLRYDGHVRLDCTFPEGGTLKADVTFDGCASVPQESDD